ncbi:MAG: tetratricopeptide repeat protein, partial [bacterium]
MTRLSLRCPRSATSALLAALALACATQSLQAPAMATAPQPARELRVGEPVEAELSRDDRRLYTLLVEPGQYLRIVAKPRTIDIALRLLAPDGAVLATADGPGGSRMPELLSLLISISGRAQLEVTRRDQGERRGYQLVLEEQRPARPDDPLRIEAERAYYDAAHRRSLGSADEMHSALQILERALPLWQQIGDRRGEIDTLALMGLSHRRLGATDKAVELLTRALGLAESAGYDRGLIEALNGMALVDKLRGRLDDALAGFRRALDIARALGSTEQEAAALQNMGFLLFDRGDPREALGYLELALPMWKALGQLGEEGNTAQTLGLIYHRHHGNPDKAAEHFQAALVLSREASDRRTEAGAVLNLAGISRDRRQLQSALAGYREARELLRAVGDPNLLAIAEEALGSLYYDLGDLDKAAHHYREAEMSYRSREDLNAQVRV